MNIYISDKEQIEMIKNWWRENGKFTLFSILIVLVGTIGWRYWQNSKNQEAAHASIIYEQTLTYEANHQLTEAELEVTRLLANYPNTPYATLAAFLSAQNAINRNRLDLSLEKLDWIIHHSKNKDFKQIAKIRKARILLTMEKYDESLALLANIDAETYLPLIKEVEGDILFAKGKRKEALVAYQNALSSLRKDAPNRSLLQMKYNQLNG
jgi:predicted negative regulator of RcsB-dependent stress response